MLNRWESSQEIFVIILISINIQCNWTCSSWDHHRRHDELLGGKKPKVVSNIHSIKFQEVLMLKQDAVENSHVLPWILYQCNIIQIANNPPAGVNIRTMLLSWGLAAHQLYETKFIKMTKNVRIDKKLTYTYKQLH